jgi:predicted transcriptional regulator of viral defense system
MLVINEPTGGLKMNPDLRKSALIEEVDYNFIKHALREYKNPRVKINDLLKKKEIIRVKKGLYVFGAELARQPYSKETLANLIYGPSYISLEYALSFYGLIPERVETITSVTNKRNKFFKTPVGNFSYRYLNPMIYAYEITLHEIDTRHSILIATREKAISDLLYFTDKMTDQKELENYLVENLRLESADLSDLNLGKLMQLAALYGHNVNLFCNLLRDRK